MSKFILAGVGTVQLFDPSNGELIVGSKTLFLFPRFSNEIKIN